MRRYYIEQLESRLEAQRFIKTFMMNDERETYIDTRPGPSNEDGIRLALIQAKLFARLKSPRPISVCSSLA